MKTEGCQGAAGRQNEKGLRGTGGFFQGREREEHKNLLKVDRGGGCTVLRIYLEVGL